jgi:hypothetical protein
VDEIVLRAQAKWPGVPDVYGWLSLDRRGRWLLCDARGRWFFQNGPQRVFVRLAYTPLVARADGGTFVDQCGRTLETGGAMLDEEGCVLLPVEGSIALLDDRDLAAYAEARGDAIERLPRIQSRDVPARFSFVPDPAP